MATTKVQPEEKKVLDVVAVTAAIIIAIGGFLGFTFLSDQTIGIRLGVLFGCLVVAVVVAAISPAGRRFLVYGRESYDELRRVVWPSRKETINTTGFVMAFVAAIAFYLWIVDKLVELALYDGLLRITF